MQPTVRWLAGSCGRRVRVYRASRRQPAKEIARPVMVGRADWLSRKPPNCYHYGDNDDDDDDGGGGGATATAAACCYHLRRRLQRPGCFWPAGRSQSSSKSQVARQAAHY